MASIGSLIKVARLEKGMSQEELARTIGTTKSAISRYEAGKRLPNYDQLNAIAAALGVEWEKLVPVDAKGAVIAAHVIKKAGLKLVSKEDGEVKHPPTPRERIDAAFERLNDDGKEKAAESIEIIAGNPKYQRLARKDTPVAAPLQESTENGE